jgi:hypothetical protein
MKLLRKRDHVGAFTRGSDVRRYWMMATYIMSVLIATIGWLWLIVWLVMRI